MAEAVNRQAKVQYLPLVSVIMNCLDGALYLREAIDSVYAQTYQNWEIIFWDNASVDTSSDIARSYDKRLRYFRGDKTVPLYEARNFALKKASGDIIAFLDCDDKWFPSKLEKQVPLFYRNEVGLVFSNTIFYNQQTGKERVLYKKTPPTGRIFEQLLSGYFLSLETVMVRRKYLEGLPEWFDKRFHHVGDADLFLRLAYQWEIAYVDEVLAVWRMHNASGTWKKTALFGIEWKMILEKYATLYDNFYSRYAPAVKKIKGLAAYYDAMEQWEKNNRTEVRRLLLPHIKSRPKLLIAYLLSALPFEQYTGLLRIIGRHA